MTRLQETAHTLLNLFGPNGEHWCQGAAWRDKHGRVLPVIDRVPEDEIGSQCLMGGMSRRYLKVSGYESNSPRVEELRDALPEGWSSIPRFNDNNPWPVIKAWLLQLAKGESQ